MTTNGHSIYGSPTHTASPNTPQKPPFQNDMLARRPGPTYGQATSLFPSDAPELDRLDIFHKLFQVARQGEPYSDHEGLHRHPLTWPSDQPGPFILDLGTGSGIWAIDMADKYYPGSFVLGLELHPWQTRDIPNNLAFELRDIEGPWRTAEINMQDPTGERRLRQVREGEWNMVHIRTLHGSVRDWHSLYEKAFRHLRPGFGQFEQVEIDWMPHYEGRGPPPNSALAEWITALLEATDRAGKPMKMPSPEVVRRELEEAGFSDVQHRRIKIPFNPWSPDVRERETGQWMNLGLMSNGLESLSVGPFYDILGWDREHLRSLLARVKEEICSRDIHAFCYLHIFTATRAGH